MLTDAVRFSNSVGNQTGETRRLLGPETTIFLGGYAGQVTGRGIRLR
jgi:hypothetical protein